MVQRFLKDVDVRDLLFRFFNSDSKIVIGDVTELERPEAEKTGYVGKLKGEVFGF